MTLTTPLIRAATTATEDSQDPTAVLSGFRVDRVAGLSVADLHLDFDRTAALAQELDCLEREIVALAEPVSNLLFTLVPAVGDDTTTRRAILAVRRSCGGLGKGPPAAKVAAVLAAVTRFSVSSEAELLHRWLATWRRRECALAELDTAYEKDLEEVCQTLGTALTEQEVATGIAQASPLLGRRLAEADLRPGCSQARSIGGYLTRAARKTSPFSFLTTVGDDSPAAPCVERETLTVAQEYVAQLLDLLARDAQILPAFQLEPLSTPGRNPMTDAVLVPEIAHRAEFTWRMDRAVRLAGLGPVLARLQDYGRRPANDYLAGIGDDDAFLTVRRLIDVDLLRVVAPWSYAETDRLDRLATAVAILDTPHATAFALRIQDIAADTRALTESHGRDRADALLCLGARAAELISELGGTPSDSTFAIHSDAVPAQQIGSLGTPVTSDLTQLGRAIRPLIFRSHAYDVIRDCFVESFGAGGRCSDVHDFLQSVAARSDQLGRALALDERTKGRPGERHLLPVSASSAPPSTSVLYQLAAQSLSDIHAGRHQLVVNQFHPGGGGLVSRFRGAPGHEALRTSLRDWARSLYPQARVIEFIASSGVNHMQSACEGTFPRLRWPTEPPVDGNEVADVTIDELRIRHDVGSDTLEIHDAYDTPVAPVYLGLVPAHLLNGAERILTILSDPWVNGAATSLRRLPPAPTGEGIAHQARVQRARIVTRRATWTLRAEDLPVPDPGESEARYLRRLDSWRQEHGIPAHVFVRRVCTSRSMATGARKPFWMSFRNPHTIGHLLNAIDEETSAVTLVEVLPDDRQLWLHNAAQNPLVVEHLTHLRWPRPSDSRTAPTEGGGEDDHALR